MFYIFIWEMDYKIKIRELANYLEPINIFSYDHPLNDYFLIVLLVIAMLSIELLLFILLIRVIYLSFIA